LVSKNGAVSPRPAHLHPAHEAGVSAEKETLAAQPAVLPSSKRDKAALQRSQLSQTPSKIKKLVCRYCGSDDIAPSFKKRRDARCRACFKQRYGSTSRGKQDMRARKAKAAK
jgi:hypothetical protein